MTAPLRLVPRIPDREAADVALVEAVLTGLPPGGRVLVAGDPAQTGWLADALAAVEAPAVCSPLPAGDGAAPLFADDDGYDAVVADAAALHDGDARRALAALARVLAPGGRLLVQAPPEGTRALGAWVRLLAGAGLWLRDLREPSWGGLAGTVFVCEALT